MLQRPAVDSRQTQGLSDCAEAPGLIPAVWLAKLGAGAHLVPKLQVPCAELTSLYNMFPNMLLTTPDPVIADNT